MNDYRDLVSIDICGRVNPEGFIRHFAEGHVGQRDLSGLERDRAVYRHVQRCRNCKDGIVDRLEYHASVNPSFDVGAVFRYMTFLEDGADFSRFYIYLACQEQSE